MTQTSLQKEADLTPRTHMEKPLCWATRNAAPRGIYQKQNIYLAKMTRLGIAYDTHESSRSFRGIIISLTHHLLLHCCHHTYHLRMLKDYPIQCTLDDKKCNSRLIYPKTWTFESPSQEMGQEKKMTAPLAQKELLSTFRVIMSMPSTLFWASARANKP